MDAVSEDPMSVWKIDSLCPMGQSCGMCIHNISNDHHVSRNRFNYTLRTEGVCGATSISTLPECSQAAAVLGLPDVAASYDFDGGLDHLPSFCYLMNGNTL